MFRVFLILMHLQFYLVFGFLVIFAILLFCCVLFIMESADRFSVQYLIDVASNVALAYKLTPWHFVPHKFESVAQNYFGVIIPGKVSGFTKEGKREFSLVLKLAPTDERYRVSGAVTDMFQREIYMYTEVLAEISALQASFPPESQHTFPKCYHACKEYLREVLVLQDMCADGYQPYTHSMFLDLKHITVSVEALAKFHAMSINLKADNFKLFQEASESCLPLSKMYNPRFMQILLDRLHKAIDKFSDTVYVPLLENLKTNYVNFVESTYKSVIISSICHGDMWKENILFKYEGHEPVAACLIDYQTARLCSPAYDLLYLIITSTSTELRRDHFSEMLDIYYSTFAHTLKEANLFAKDIYTREQLDIDLKTVAPGCLIVSNTAMWLACGLQEEGHVRSKVVLRTSQEKEQAIEKYKNIIKGICDDFFAYGYLEAPIN